MDDYIIGRLESVTIDNNGEGGLGGSKGEIVLAAVSAVSEHGSGGVRVQKVQAPAVNWYEASDGDDLLSLTSGRRYGLPFLCLREAEMGERLMVTLTLVEDDTPALSALADVGTRVVPAVGSAVGSSVASPAVGAGVGAGLEAVSGAIRSSWDQDVIAVHSNVLLRDDDWGVGRPPVSVSERLDGAARFTYRLERLTVPTGMRVRVRLNRIHVPEDLDTNVWPFTDASDIYVFARAWAGEFTGEIPNQVITRMPASGERSMDTGSVWDVNAVVYEGVAKPFLLTEIAVWDNDRPARTDELHGMITDFRTTSDLFRAFHARGWRPIREQVSCGPHLTLDYQIEPVDPLTVELQEWWSADRGDHYTTTHPLWTAAARNHHHHDYVRLGSLGYAYSKDVPQPPGTVPIYSWWSPSRGDNFTTTQPDWAGRPGDRRAPDYGFVRIDGYLYDPILPQPTGTVPVYSWWSPRRQDNRMTNAREWAGPLRATRAPDYTCFRLDGYALTIF
jgi:hypothetical protein